MLANWVADLNGKYSKLAEMIMVDNRTNISIAWNCTGKPKTNMKFHRITEKLSKHLQSTHIHRMEMKLTTFYI
jgi:hypothetical protein